MMMTALDHSVIVFVYLQVSFVMQKSFDLVKKKLYFSFFHKPCTQDAQYNN